MRTLLENQKLNGFTQDDTGFYALHYPEALFALQEGLKYVVVWDGMKRVCTAYSSSTLGYPTIYIGNGDAIGGESANEPFLILYTPHANYLSFFTDILWSSHNVTVIEYAHNDISILNYEQDPVVYEDVPKLWATHASGEGKVPFTYGEIAENVRIVPDFSAGDMVVAVPDGYLVKEATVVQPPELVPENIAEGVTVAGIEGTHTGGGGVNLEGDLLKYLVYQLDDENKELIIFGILYESLYVATGSYDLHIPSKFGAYKVVIYSEGMT